MSKTLTELSAAKEQVAAVQASVSHLREQRAKIAAQAERVAATIAQARTAATEATRALGDAIAAQTVGQPPALPIDEARSRMNRAVEKAESASSLEPEHQALQAALRRLDAELLPQEEVLQEHLTDFRAKQDAALGLRLGELGKDLNERAQPIMRALADLLAEANALNSTAIMNSLPSVYGPLHTPTLVLEDVGRLGRVIIPLAESTASARDALSALLRADGLALRA